MKRYPIYQLIFVVGLLCLGLSIASLTPVKAEGTTIVEQVILPIGASHEFVKNKYGVPDTKVLRGGLVTWMYTKPKISVLFNKQGVVVGWIQKHQ